MNKESFISKLAAKSKMPKKKTEMLLEKTLEIISEKTEKEGKADIEGLGTFKKSFLKARFDKAGKILPPKVRIEFNPEDDISERDRTKTDT